ncbi:multidrug ABC transporter ATPase [Burkholderia multivorans]|uniref:multidrug ABC transporter ATPase n=1 Tax=Burkholderia multivorans TaxID=87883 RepID=UPI000D003881|nr:multidrug ABC transporter ATPase [Burkholderia multivorans]PRF36274.1 multidrug ABC transporter ATPase [Burkholderia multivorans]
MFAMLFLKNAAGALRRTLTDTAHHVFSGPHRGWKIALYVAMLVLPGGSLAALGFAWFDHRRQRNAKGASRRTPGRAATEPPSWRLAAHPLPVRR